MEELRSHFSTAIRQARHSLNNMRHAERTLSRAEGRLAALEVGDVAAGDVTAGERGRG